MAGLWTLGFGPLSPINFELCQPVCLGMETFELTHDSIRARLQFHAGLTGQEAKLVGEPHQVGEFRG
jgi:hypothetical protein